MTSLHRNPRLWVAAGAMVLLPVGGVSVLASTAYLSTSATSSGAAVTAGTVTLSFAGGATSAVRGAAVSAWITTTSTGVGSSSASYKDLTVTNAGGGALRFAMASVPSGTGTGLTTTNEIAVDVATITSGQTCNSTNFAAGTTVSTSGAVLGNGTDTTEVKIIGDKTTSQQTGDQVLAAGASSTLCMRVYVKPGAGRAAQAVSSIASTFWFYAEQTRNNP